MGSRLGGSLHDYYAISLFSQLLAQFGNVANSRIPLGPWVSAVGTDVAEVSEVSVFVSQRREVGE